MAISLWTSRRSDFHRCLWYSADPKSRMDASAIVASSSPSGSFYARDEASVSTGREDEMGAFRHDSSTVTISTRDRVDGIKPDDVVTFDGRRWRVEDVQSRPFHRESQFSSSENAVTYLRLRG